MSDRTKDLYAALAKAKALRAHAEECNRAISRTAESWMPAADEMSKRLDIASEAEALEPGYNSVGALNLARGKDLLRKLRDGA